MNYLNPNLSATTEVGFFYETGLRIVFIRSEGTLIQNGAFGVGHPRLYEVGHPAIRSREFRVKYPVIQNRTSRQYTGIVPLFEVGYLR